MAALAHRALVGEQAGDTVWVRPAVATGAIDATSWETHIAMADGDPLGGELWTLIADGVAGARMGDPRRALGAAQKMKSREVERRFPVVDEAQRAMGVASLDVYLCPEGAGVAVATSGRKPSLYLSEDVASQGGATERFVLGRALGQLRAGTGTMLEMTAQEFASYVAAAVRLAGAEPTVELMAEARHPSEVDERARRLDRELGRRERKALKAAAQRFASLSSAERVYCGARRQASYVGMLWSQDLYAALKVEFGDDWRERLTDNADALALLSFSVSRDMSVLSVLLGWGG
jgi:hypothetical protein